MNRLRKLLDNAILTVFPEVYDSVLPAHAKATKRKEPMDRTDIMPKKTRRSIANVRYSVTSSASCIASNIEQSPVQAIVPEEEVRKAVDDARKSRVEQLETENEKLRLELASPRPSENSSARKESFISDGDQGSRRTYEILYWFFQLSNVFSLLQLFAT